MTNKSKEERDLEGQELLQNGATLQLKGVKTYDAFNVVSAFISAQEVQTKVSSYVKSAAQMVFDLALGIEAGNPTLTPSEIYKMFVDEMEQAIVRHKKMGHLPDNDWEKKFKNLDQAYRKVKGALSNGAQLASLGSCNACEKHNTKVAEDQALEAKQKQLEKDAQALVDSGRFDTLEAAIDYLTKPVQPVEDSSKGEVSANDSPVLQDNIDSHGFDQDLVAFLITIGERLNKVGEADEDKLRTLTQSINGKIDGAIGSLLKGKGSEGKADLYPKSKVA